MEEACEIARLPEELLSAALARTSPRDAFRAAAVSPAFRAAGESDEVWASFLPPGGLPPLADGELTAPAPPSSKKELFLRLSAGPVLLEDRLVSMWLDREAGSKCYMLSAWNLESAWSGDTPDYPRRVPLEDSRFSDGIQLWDVCYLKILGKIHSKMLSQDTTYAAYMVFKMTDNYYGVYFPLHEATGLPRTVCLQGNEDEGGVADNYRPIPLMTRIRNRSVVFHEGNVMFPQKRADGWMELELGEFFNEGGDDDEVSFSLNETKGLIWERGLIMQGIEIRRKKSG